VLALYAEHLEEQANSVVEPRPPIKKLNLLLLELGRRTRTFGGSFALDQNRAWPLIFARDETEFIAIRQALVDQTRYVTASSAGLVLTAAGWERYEQLEKEQPHSKKAFVAMRFSDEMQTSYDEGFYPALYELGYDPIRVDREHYLGRMTTSSLRASETAVCWWRILPRCERESFSRPASEWDSASQSSGPVERTGVPSSPTTSTRASITT
jgi:hypothetical protein